MLEEKILCFDSYHSIEYWFKKIYDHLNKLDLVFRIDMNRYIFFGNQIWIFLVPDKTNLIGRQHIPTFYSLAERFEKDFDKTMIDILKGESNG